MASTPQIAKDKESTTDEGTDSPTSEHASQRFPQSPKIVAWQFNSERAPKSTKTQSASPSKSMASTSILPTSLCVTARYCSRLAQYWGAKNEKPVNLPSKWTLAHTPELSRVLQEPWDSPTQCGGFDASDHFCRLPLRTSLLPCQNRRDTTTNQSDS